MSISASELLSQFEMYEDDVYDEHFDEIEESIREEERFEKEEKEMIRLIIEQNLKEKINFVKYHNCKKHFHQKDCQNRCENCQFEYSMYISDCMYSDWLDSRDEEYFYTSEDFEDM